MVSAVTETPRATRGFTDIIQGGAPDHKYYVDVLKASATIYPGRIVTTEGDTDGECHLATAADGLIAGFHIVLRRVGCPPQDLDTAITIGQKAECLRPAGGRFIVAAIKVDQSAATELDEPMRLGANGMLHKWAYVNSTFQSDSIGDGFWKCAEVVADIASTSPDRIQLIYW